VIWIGSRYGEARGRSVWPSRIRRLGARCASALGLALLVASAVGAGERRRDRFDAVIIDAGHGGEDEGARGAKGLVEKELVLDVTRRLAKRLEAQGIRVILTRRDDTFVPLEARTSVANDAHGDLFISIHANSASTRKPRGIETYFVSLESSDESAKKLAARENESFGAAGRVPGGDDPLMALLGDMIVTEHVIESSEFAKLVQGELAALDAKSSRGVKQAPFVVLMGVQMPASLIEIGFLSNPAEEKALRRSDHRDAIVSAVSHAVIVFAKRYDARRGVGAELSAIHPGE